MHKDLKGGQHALGTLVIIIVGEQYPVLEEVHFSPDIRLLGGLPSQVGIAERGDRLAKIGRAVENIIGRAQQWHIGVVPHIEIPGKPIAAPELQEGDEIRLREKDSSLATQPTATEGNVPYFLFSPNSSCHPGVPFPIHNSVL